MQRRGSSLRQEGDMGGDSESRNAYGKKQGSRSQGYRPGSNLGTDGEHDWNTDKGYKEYDVSRRGRHRGYGDNLGPGDGRMDDDTTSKEYKKYDGGERSHAHRRGSTLGPEGDQQWDTDKGYKKHDVQRQGRYKGYGDNLRPGEGKLEDGTTQKEYKNYEGGDRSHAQRRGSTLGPEGDQEWDTDKGYKKHDVQRQDRHRGYGDNLGPGEGKLDDDTTNKEYKKYDGGDRAHTQRRGSTLGPEGDQEWDTDKGYKKHDVQRQDRHKGYGDNLGPGEGKLDDGTTNQEYKRYEGGDRAQAHRRGSTLGPEGDQEWDTDKGYKRHDIQRPDRHRGYGDNLGPGDGKLDDDTTHKEYKRYEGGDRTHAYRRGSALGPEGEHEWDTDKGFRKHDVQRQERHRGYGDNLTPGEGRLDDDTTHKEYKKYEGGGKMLAQRRGSTLGPEGQQEWDTDKGYKKHDVQRQDRHRGHGDNLTPLEGKLDDSTTHQEFKRYEGGDRAHAHRRGSVLAPEGRHDWDTDKGYKEHDVSRTERYRGYGDNLRPSEGRLEGDTEAQDKFRQKSLSGRIRGRRREDDDQVGIGERGRLDSATENKDQFKPKQGMRDTRVRVLFHFF